MNMPINLANVISKLTLHFRRIVHHKHKGVHAPLKVSETVWAFLNWTMGKAMQCTFIFSTVGSMKLEWNKWTPWLQHQYFVTLAVLWECFLGRPWLQWLRWSQFSVVSWKNCWVEYTHTMAMQTWPVCLLLMCILRNECSRTVSMTHVTLWFRLRLINQIQKSVCLLLLLLHHYALIKLFWSLEKVHQFEFPAKMLNIGSISYK